MKPSSHFIYNAMKYALGPLIILGFVLISASCQSPVGPPPTLNELHLGEQLKESAKRLIHIPLGAHRLTPTDLESPRAIVAVHGYGSRGIEWVSSLHQFAESGAHVYWLRWDWNQCPKAGMSNLQNALKKIQKQHPKLQSIEIFGHSYGGVISTMLAQNTAFSIPVRMHVIASPLAGMGKLKSLCPDTNISGTPLAKAASLTQWRTQHKIDGAFKDEAKDPQIVSIPGARFIDLPGTFDDRRLGHNWSVSYVATQWLANQKTSEPTPKVLDRAP
jgi:pimeloyl-ACP methyl ester carboxylesterase